MGEESDAPSSTAPAATKAGGTASSTEVGNAAVLLDARILLSLVGCARHTEVTISMPTRP
ncbi:hypothetical protein H257_03694 [Aphanomyces astaci]|uniref:Uncharacterized protein n=1 Tax=Aphanomyces astaci TaxID=112090 RepID=W4H019_APHAT|nr:hypothetical protein H257_03694 [Aphanomyces astaci]ETV84508.1 hypothetical protein H257_03694 [Aphanomyces astaci]|eukprot:XP_009826200.1 hypothetical protein H257_03694 [Aphanomyces astaci]